MARHYGGTTADYIRIADDPSIRAQRPMSVACWVRRDAPGEEDRLLWKRIIGNRGWAFIVTTTNLLSMVFFGIAQKNSTVGVGTGTGWMHVGFSASAAGVVKFYLNGAQLGADVTGLGAPSDDGGFDLFFGVRTTDTTGNIDGASDFDQAEVVVSREEWPASVFAALTHFSPRMVFRSATNIRYWPLYGRSSPEPEVYDHLDGSVNGNVTPVAHPPLILPRRRTVFFAPATGLRIIRANASVQAGPASVSVGGGPIVRASAACAAEVSTVVATGGSAVNNANSIVSAQASTVSASGGVRVRATGSPTAGSASVSASASARVSVRASANAQAATVAAAAGRVLIRANASARAGASRVTAVGRVDPGASPTKFKRWWLGLKLRLGA